MTAIITEMKEFYDLALRNVLFCFNLIYQAIENDKLF